MTTITSDRDTARKALEEVCIRKDFGLAGDRIRSERRRACSAPSASSGDRLQARPGFPSGRDACLVSGVGQAARCS
jgi:hypothetical protein